MLVLEASDFVGGFAARREFHPGFHASVAHSVSHFPTKIISDLNLKAHGLESGEPLPLVGLAADGNHVILSGDSIAGASDDDTTAWHEYRQEMQRYAGALNPFWLKTMPRIGFGDFSGNLTFAHIGLNLRRLGRNNMREFLRVVSLPTRDLMDENFDSDVLKTLLSWDGLIGLKQAPRSPNHSVLAMLYRSGRRYALWRKHLATSEGRSAVNIWRPFLAAPRIISLDIAAGACLHLAIEGRELSRTPARDPTTWRDPAARPRHSSS